MQQIPHRELNGKTLVEDIMKYQFSTEAQLKLLIERKGYTAQTDADRNLLIQKDTRTIGTIDRKAISEKLKNKPDGERIKQLRAIFHKYQTDLIEEFQKLMKEKFGVELIFHRAGGHETPYGYTVIDHATKQVFKGSDVFKLSELLKNRVGEVRENRHIEALKERQNDKDKFDDYMNQQDLFLMSKGGNTFMIDRANNEVTNVSSHSFFKGHIFMDIDDSQKMTQGIDLNLGISGSETQETDRKKKRSPSR
jgi:hypothetical protein